MPQERQTVTLTIGRFDFTLHYYPDFWLGGWRWGRQSPDEADGSPEEKHYEALVEKATSIDWDKDFAAEMQRLLEAYPFNKG